MFLYKTSCFFKLRGSNVGLLVIVIVVYMLSFEPLLIFFFAYSTKVSHYMLGSSSSNSKRDKYINAWIRVQYRFIFLGFLFSELFI